MQIVEMASVQYTKLRQDLGEIVCQQSAESSYEANTLGSPSIKPVKPMHSVDWLEHLDT